MNSNYNTKRNKSYFVIFDFGPSAILTYTAKDFWNFAKYKNNWYYGFEKDNESINFRLFGIELAIYTNVL